MSPGTGSRESPWGRLADWAWPGHPATWRDVPARLRPTLGTVLRLGEQALETPISAMLILGVSNHDVASETRIVNTLVGAAVGMAGG